MNRNSVIYCIENVVTGKKYVGSARRGLAYRKYFHLLQLRAGKHHSRYLQRSWNKHGEAAFKFYVLEKVGIAAEKERLLAREQHWMGALSVCDPRHGYNCSPTAGSNAGSAFYKSASFRAKQSAKAKRMGLGLKHPPRTVEHSINQGKTQAKFTDEQIKRIRERLAIGHKQEDIASDYGVTDSTISNISRGKGVVYGGVSRLDYRPRKRAKITDEMRERMRALGAGGMKQKDIAAQFGCSQAAVSLAFHR